MSSHEKVKAPGTRTAESHTDSTPSEPSSKGRVGETSSTGGNFGFGTAGAFGQAAATVDPITGGILSQLVKQVKGQLAEARECVDWYERKSKEYQEQLDQLEHLQQQLEQQQSDE